MIIDRYLAENASEKGHDPKGDLSTGSLRLLGAQIIGTSGVDRRINVLATALHAGIRGPALKKLHLVTRGQLALESAYPRGMAQN